MEVDKMINALGANILSALHNNANRVNQSPMTSTANFGEFLGSAMSSDDVISRFRSNGVPINIGTPRQMNSLGSNGVSIAPSIIDKMAQDEEIAREKEDIIWDWLFVRLPAARQEFARRGAELRWYGISIEPDGTIVEWYGGVLKEYGNDDEERDGLLRITRSRQTATDNEVVTETFTSANDVDKDLSHQLALFGDTNLRLQKRDD
jgi:hypothetical protein